MKCFPTAHADSSNRLNLRPQSNAGRRYPFGKSKDFTHAGFCLQNYLGEITHEDDLSFVTGMGLALTFLPSTRTDNFPRMEKAVIQAQLPPELMARAISPIEEG